MEIKKTAEFLKTNTNFNPKIVIFYTGINDSNIQHDEKFDIPWRESNFEK